MATINVSGQSQLLSAFRTAKAGDTLSLAGGSYGNVSLSTSSSNHGSVTIKSASESNQAYFKSLKAGSVSNFTIDNVKFDGDGGGTGLTIKNSSNVKVLNSDFTDYRLGSFIYEITGLTVSNNDFTRMYHDAMDFSDITNGVISRNSYVESGSENNYIHKDFIQFWTNKGYNQAASKNIQITNNEFYSKDGDTHGIFINNEWHGQKYEDITIANNYIRSSQTHGITVNYGDDITIQNNTLVKDGPGYPVINVTPDSTNVRILSNTAPSIPDQGNSSWTLSGNKETGGTNWHWTAGLSGSSVKNTGSTSGSSTGPGISGSSAAVVADPDTGGTDSSLSGIGDGDADAFRFTGTKVIGATTDTIPLDFSEGDDLVLIDYDAGTFEDQDGGNLVWHNLAGTYVKIDSITDIQELATYSDAITASVTGGDLSVVIDQDAGQHTILLEGLGEAYLSSLASAMF